MLKRLMFLMLLSTIVVAGVNRIERTVFDEYIGLIGTGVPGANDSGFVDTIPLGPTEAFHNRLYGSIILDSITVHDDISLGATFGLRDTVDLILKSSYKSSLVSHYRTIDSTRKVLAPAQTCTLSVVDATDSLFGDYLWLIVRVQDTVNIIQDGVMRPTLRVNILHQFAD